MTPHTLEYYTWDQIEKFLSNEMGQEVDLRLWLKINNDIRNDSYVVTLLTENFLEYVELYIDKYVDWDGDETPLKLIDAMRKLREELDADVITIFYSW